jgi:transcription elongation factor Elf1
MTQEVTCPHCSNSDSSMMELEVISNKLEVWYCEICSKRFNRVIDEPRPNNKAGETSK